MIFLKKFCALSFFFLATANFYAQTYSAVDDVVDNYPQENFTLSNLVFSIEKDFSSDEEKVRAVFRWITTKIKYDLDLANKMDFKSLKAFFYSTEAEKITKEKKFKAELVQQTFASKKTVCHGYAILFEYLCKALRIETEVITGTLRGDPSEIGLSTTTVNHAWNVVKINGKWKLVDTTLAAGFISEKTGLFKFDFNDGYFFIEPEIVFLNHYPLDKKWLLLVNKTKSDFAVQPFYHGAYFKYGYRIKGIPFGIISAKSESINFQIQGVDQYDVIQYVVRSDNNQKVDIQRDNSEEYKIAISNLSDDYLSIFINSRIVMTLKIIK